MSEQVRRKLKAAMQENARLQAECQARQAENSVLAIECDSLKAEVERLTEQKAVYIDNDKVLAEMERLKAEVKEKTALIAKLHKDAEISDRESMSDEYDLNHQTKVINGLLSDKEKLQAQVERLTKAADLICRMSGDNQVIKSYWKHAKKGGHS